MFNSDSNNKVLIIEDDLYMQVILSQYLGANFEVLLFTDGMDAMAFMQAGNIPDVVIADLNTPMLGGLEVLEQLKSSDFFKDIPVIILSGEERSAKRIECLKKGAEDFIAKPFNPEELETRLIKVIKRNTKAFAAA